ncbi:uncharacterized protein K452DRAFT_319656 [Aplosporella prunicola CBS 121167]|uniref:Peptidase S26 domain-containing protein n=1 Tax=Aplosporella prunicola CBS 121167 TaxID=1176127 RepID=A0A6A6BE80_9PEZI|nr:uncharacterized protein K452DRAFT_319656 [Aplosporella prunicola CBS 121167]KAF2140791.1 hypothetical protein K452DRAFT_319656 [Aplosporella prunicola CBS 121167]
MPSPRLALTPVGLLVRTFNLALLAHTFATHAYTVKPTYGASMVPTMAPIGDAVLIDKTKRRGRGITVGDLVSFDQPFRLDRGVIKRVIGMPGDFVLRDTPGKGEGMMVQVPQGHCFVAGDNQLHSRDSRIFGPVPLALVRGQVVARVFPFSSIGWFRNGLQEPVDNWEEE